jgi:sulfate adenylyltransferase
MSNLVAPHGKEEKLMPLLLEGSELNAQSEKAKSLKQIRITSKESSNLVMMGIGAFTPLTGFMTKADWQGVCDNMALTDGTFWPVPVTLSTDDEVVKEGDELALVDDETGNIMATIQVSEKYAIDKEHECKTVYTTTDTEHPGVAKVMAQPKYNLAGPVQVLSEGVYPEEFKGVYQRPMESRQIFEDLGGSGSPLCSSAIPCIDPTSSWPRSLWRLWMGFIFTSC